MKFQRTLGPSCILYPEKIIKELDINGLLASNRAFVKYGLGILCIFMAHLNMVALEYDDTLGCNDILGYDDLLGCDDTLGYDVTLGFNDTSRILWYSLG